MAAALSVVRSKNVALPRVTDQPLMRRQPSRAMAVS